MKPKVPLILATAAAGGLMVLAWSQEWLVLDVAGLGVVSVPGSAAGRGLVATGLALLATAAAFTIAGRIVRHVLGVVTVLIGAAAIALVLTVVANPFGAAFSTVVELTGNAGADDAGFYGILHGFTAWPWVGLAAGALGVLAGLGVLFTARRWPVSGARYERAPVEPEAWDALTEGDDPTR